MGRVPVLIRSRSPFNPPGTPVLAVTFRRRPCDNCHRGMHVSLWSPSTAFMCGLRGHGEGQCCIRCTRELRSP